VDALQSLYDAWSPQQWVKLAAKFFTTISLLATKSMARNQLLFFRVF
jgi:hypothetical protein